jgi:hypothetical protein
MAAESCGPLEYFQTSTYSKAKPEEKNNSEPVSFKPYGAALLLQANGSDFYYGAEADGLDPNIAVPAISPNWQILEISPGYHFGFEVGASIVLNSAKITLDVNWERLHSHDTDSFDAPPANGFMVGPIFDIGPNSAIYKNAQGTANTHFDEVKLTAVKQICSFDNFSSNFYAGGGFSRIKYFLQSNYANATSLSERISQTTSTFIGAGPLIGFDYNFRIVENFFFTGNSFLPLYMGRMTASTNYQSFTPVLANLSIPQPNFQTTTIPNRTQLIPGLEQQLGLSYSHAWKALTATLEFGYQCQIYLNAIQTIDLTAPQVEPSALSVSPDAGLFAVGFERTISNYILTGPYLFASIEF